MLIFKSEVISSQKRLFCYFLGLSVFCLLCGCGTTKWSDTGRTATEQLLISSAMEELIDEYDYYALSNRSVFVKMNSCTDSEFLRSILRQQLAANGVLVKDKEEEAEYILEVAPGASGTNRYDLMYGIPETTIPSMTGTSTTIPEVALIKRTDQEAQVKLLMWAYNKETGAIIWQSGSKTKTASVRSRWVFGAGPFIQASYDKKLKIGGDDTGLPSSVFGERVLDRGKPSVKEEAVYREIDQNSVEQLETLRAEGRIKMLNDEEREAVLAENSKSGENDGTQAEDAADTKEQPAEAGNESVPDGEAKTEESAPAPEAVTGSNPLLVGSGEQMTRSVTNPLLTTDFPAETDQKPNPALPDTNAAATPSGNANPSGQNQGLVLQFDNLTLPAQTTYVPPGRTK